jgi:hypothetical protein
MPRAKSKPKVKPVDVESATHSKRAKKFEKVSPARGDARRAFDSWEGRGPGESRIIDPSKEKMYDDTPPRPRGFKP